MQVIFGANGRTGGETARALLSRRQQVRVVLRRPDQASTWAELGAEVAIADMEDAKAVAAALNGASAAFFLNPPPVGNDFLARTRKIGHALSEGAKQAGLGKAVVLSSVGAHHPSGTGVIETLHHLEALLVQSAPAVTFLRPGYFVETWGEKAEAVIKDGLLPTFLPPAQKIPMVSTIDVGAKAAELLCTDLSGRRVVELAGPEDWSSTDVANAFASVLGRQVTPVFIPPEQRAAILRVAGIPEEVIHALLAMYEGIAAGRVAYEAEQALHRGSVSLTEAVGRILSAARN